MASKTQIVNIALARIGVSRSVANVDMEASREAVLAKTVYDDDRDYCLRDFPWPFAMRLTYLNLAAGSPAAPATVDAIYAYRYPNDAFYVRRVATILGRNPAKPPPFWLGSDHVGRLIYSNEPDAQVEYTARITDPEAFDPLFVSMLAWKLAGSLAPALSRLPEIAVTAMTLYEADRDRAQTRALNEQQQQDPHDAEWIRARG